jgi:ribonuclease P protein component
MLAKENRLTNKADFEKVRQNGRFIRTPFFSISFLDRGDEKPSRFGFIVSKKVSTKANVRNKVKRKLREMVFKYLKCVKKGDDFVVVAKSGILREKDDKIEDVLKKIICN